MPLYDGRIVPPKEGELHRRFRVESTVESTVELDRLLWSVQVDNPNSTMAQNLRSLWDATDILL
jgi:hypothetical protein